MTDADSSKSEQVATGPAQPAPDRGRKITESGIMSFGDHLEELRACSIRALLGLIATTLFSLWFADEILGFLLQPVWVVFRSHGVQPGILALSPPDTFVMYLKMALLSGLILAMPWILHQIWRFVSLGLYASEQRFLRLFAPISLLLFLSGVCFLFFIVLPVVLNFFVGFSEKISVGGEANFVQRWILPASDQPEGEDAEAELPLSETVPVLRVDPVDPPVGTVWVNSAERSFCVQTPTGVLTLAMTKQEDAAAIEPLYNLSDYVGFVLLLALAFGIAFELPLVVLFLTSMGMVSVAELRRARRYVMLGIVAAAAVLTPPDVISQILLAIPMIGLFEGALIISAMIAAKKDRTDAEATG